MYTASVVAFHGDWIPASMPGMTNRILLRHPPAGRGANAGPQTYCPRLKRATARPPLPPREGVVKVFCLSFRAWMPESSCHGRQPATVAYIPVTWIPAFRAGMTMVLTKNLRRFRLQCQLLRHPSAGRGGSRQAAIARISTASKTAATPPPAVPSGQENSSRTASPRRRTPRPAPASGTNGPSARWFRA